MFVSSRGKEVTVLIFTDLWCSFYLGELYGHKMPALSTVRAAWLKVRSHYLLVNNSHFETEDLDSNVILSSGLKRSKALF